MSAIVANRHALASVRRSAQSARLVHSSSVNQATALTAGHLSGQDVQEISLQPIFDIFDAPTRLAESGAFIREKYRSTRSTAQSTVAVASSTSVAGEASQMRSQPTSLPPPIVFDGPARPRNATLAAQSRLRQAGLIVAPQPSSRQTSQAAASMRTFSSSEPLIQMFDGPARITRYHHQPSGESQVSIAFPRLVYIRPTHSAITAKFH